MMCFKFRQLERKKNRNLRCLLSFGYECKCCFLISTLFTNVNFTLLTQSHFRKTIGTDAFYFYLFI